MSIQYRSQCSPNLLVQFFFSKGGYRNQITPPPWIRPWALVKWLSCLLGKPESAGLNPSLAFKFPKKNIYISSPLTREGSYRFNIVGSLRDPEVARLPRTARARRSNPVFGGQCHLIHLTILRKFSWPSLAYMCSKVA